MFDSAGSGENNQTFFFCGERTSSVKPGNHATISFLFFFLVVVSGKLGKKFVTFPTRTKFIFLPTVETL